MASILLPPRINFLKEGWTRERSRTSRFFLAVLRASSPARRTAIIGMWMCMDRARKIRSSGNLGGSKIWRKLLRWWKQTWVWSAVHDSPCSRRSVTSSYMLWRILIRQFTGCQHYCGHTTESTHVMNILFYLQVWTTSIWSLDMLTEVKTRSWTSNRRQEKTLEWSVLRLPLCVGMKSDIKHKRRHLGTPRLNRSFSRRCRKWSVYSSIVTRDFEAAEQFLYSA